MSPQTASSIRSKTLKGPVPSPIAGLASIILD